MIPHSQPSSPDRRQFLATSLRAAGSALGAGLVSQCATTGSTSSGYIDAHVHIWTPDRKNYPHCADPQFEKDMTTPSFTPEQLFAQCRPEGVTRIVLIQMSFYQYDNRYMLDMMEKYRGAFSGVAIVNENAPDVCATMKSLARRGVRGFRIYTSREQIAAWGEGMKKVWACAGDHGLAMCLLADPGALAAVRQWCAQYPRTPVVIDHFARLGMKHPAKPAEVDHLCRLAEFPQIHVKTSAFYALGKKKAPYLDLAPLIRRLRDSYGASRLMWASDCPYQVLEGHTYHNSIALIRDRLDFLTTDDKQWMLRKTAEKVFFS
jgi:predicted TIM-barrel fold metal-dependent hydrolase